jgi:hypothetical protein
MKFPIPRLFCIYIEVNGCHLIVPTVADNEEICISPSFHLLFMQDTHSPTVRKAIVLLNQWLLALLVVVAVVGTLLAQYSWSPSYLNDRRNVFNVYFVKLGWFWTSLIVALPLIHGQYDKESSAVQRIGHFAICTLLWFVLTVFFEQVDLWTGSCTLPGITSGRECYRSGGTWDSFDISGHAFLLVFSSLILLDHSKKTPQNMNMDTLVIAAECLSLIIRLLWVFMLFTTWVHFHTLLDKLLGALFGVGAWYLAAQAANKFNSAPRQASL